MPYMTRIPSDLARFGLKVELVPGWATRGSSSFAPAGVVNHWTAGPRGTTGRPSLGVCTNGRTGLPGPLCNVYLARNGVCVVVAAGRANHAGTGGFRGLVGNSAVYGIEAESGGDGDWTPEMLDAYPRLDAALLAGLGRDATWLCDHATWAPGRKIDTRDIIAAVKRQTATILANPTQEDDMFSDQDRKDMQQIKLILDQGFVPVTNEGAFPGGGTNAKGELTHRIRASHGLDVAQSTAVNALAKLVAEQNGLALEDVRKVVAEEIAKGLDVDVTIQPGT